MPINQSLITKRNVRIRRNRRGATLIEFSLTVGLAFFFFFAALEFCRVSMLRHGVELALYEGGRKGIVPGATVTDVRDKAASILKTIGITNASIDVTPTQLTNNDTEVQVRIRIPLDRGLFAPAIFFVGKTLDRTLVMQREGNRT